MVYRLALGTGLRAKELRSLTPASFRLDGDEPTVSVSAAHTKRQREDTQPIRGDLAELLHPWLAGRPSDEELFAKLPQATARMLRSDLKAARAMWISEAKTDQDRREREKSDFLEYRNKGGEVFDFHSTRHTYISAVVVGGASVKTCQELARHSTPTLTIGRYAHTRIHDLRGALDSLPDLTPSPETKPQVANLGATGTDDAVPITQSPINPDDTKPGQSKGEQKGQQLKGKEGQKVAKGGETSAHPTDAREGKKTLAFPGKKNRRRVMATAGDQYPLGALKCDFVRCFTATPYETHQNRKSPQK
jgi:hypothetical protein